MILRPSLVSAALLLATGVFSTPVDIKLGRTTITGDYDATNGVDAFLGIQYATSKRFERAVMTEYKTPRAINATVHAPACFQTPSNVGFDFTKYGLQEDCQFLEVYRPHGTTGKLPVLVFIHGGAGNYGSANVFTGYNFVKQSVAINMPVMVVSINYRLAAWGMLGGKEASTNDAVNLGLYDQRTALKWIRANIEAFGGDRDKVTLWGQSAGSMDVHYHFLDEKTDLFRAAIMESGNVHSVPALETQHHQPSYDALVELAGCKGELDTFKCLKTVDAATLQKAVDTMVTNPTAYSTRPWGFVIDKKIIPDAPSKMLACGQFAKKPFINGDTLDEGTSYPTRNVSTVEGMWKYFETDYLNKDSTWLSNEKTKAEILRLYPDDPALGSPFNTGAELFGAGPEFKRAAAIYGDIRYQAPRRDWFNIATKEGVKGWAYQLEKPFPGAPPVLGVQHSADLLYVFLMLPSSITEYYTLAVKMVNHWIAFAHNLDPNYEGGTQWPAYGEEKNLMSFTYGDLSVVPDTFRKEGMDYLISVQDQFGNPLRKGPIDICLSIGI